jgi:DNA-binding transcriptional MerR regulator
MEAGAKGKTYKIGQAAKLLDVKPFVLRFWETEFKDVLVPVRTPSGQRAYSEANVEMVREIKRLLYDEGLTIEGAKKRLHQGKGQPSSQPSSQPGSQPGSKLGSQASDQASGQTPPQSPLAPAAPAQPGHSIESQHFEAQPPLPGLARPEAVEAARQARALAGTLADVRQELQAIRDLLA